MRIRYSFWGFLGPGITDTPDGGRSHRRTLIDGLCTAGHDIVFLQLNRDLCEAGDDLTGRYRWDVGLPDIDALFLEWALDALPQDLQGRYGEVVLTVHNGEYLRVPLDGEGELVAELRERGYEVTRDDDLINLLDGLGLGSVTA